MLNSRIDPILGLENIPTFKEGSGIHIKKKNRGKFTKSAKAAGESVLEHAAHVLKDPNATPLLKKRANFARNAAKWKHQQGGTIEPDWSDKLEPYMASLGLAGDAIGLGAAATGIGAPIGAAIAAVANVPNLAIDAYLTVRDLYRSFKGTGNVSSAAWNGGELALDVLGLKFLNSINKASKAGVASKRILNSTEKALSSKPWKRVGTGAGRVMALQSAEAKRIYNAKRAAALIESNRVLARRGVRPSQGQYYLNKLADEMAKRGYGIAVNDAIKSTNRTLRQNLATISGISGGVNTYHILQEEKGGKVHKPFGHRSILDNGWQSTKLLKNKKNVYGK